MLTSRFNSLWNLLVGRWFAYQDAPRTPDDVVELASARAALDDVRSEIAEERGIIASASRPLATVSRVAVSDEDLARLRVAGVGNDHA